MKKILAPVSFSAASDHAARYAADMALSLYADLYLLHVVRMPVDVSGMLMPDYLYEEMQAIGTNELRRLQEELIQRTDGKLNVLTHMEIGQADAVIGHYCMDIKPFLVVMGASGGSGYAIRHLAFPLIVVPEHAGFRPIKKIALACDLEDFSSNMPVATTFLQEIKKAFGAQLEVVNIMTAKERSEADQVFIAGCWKDRMHEMFKGVHFVETDKVKDGVNQYLRTSGADLLLVFPKEHHLLALHKSQAKNIALDSPIPVMSVHA